MKGTLEDVVAELDGGADPNHPSIAGVSPLFTAALVGNMAMCELLLKRGADFHQSSELAANVALMSATNFGRREIADHFVLLGADINAPNKDGHTLLMKAALDGKRMAAMTLLHMGADHALKAPDNRDAQQMANDAAAASLPDPMKDSLENSLGKGNGARMTAHYFNTFLARQSLHGALGELSELSKFSDFGQPGDGFYLIDSQWPYKTLQSQQHHQYQNPKMADADAAPVSLRMDGVPVVEMSTQGAVSTVKRAMLRYR